MQRTHNITYERSVRFSVVIIYTCPVFLQSLQSTPQQTEHCRNCGNITGSNNFQPFPTKWLEGKGPKGLFQYESEPHWLVTVRTSNGL